MRSVAIRITGTVQGVGFRPFVYRIAHDHRIVGLVGNDPGGVFIEAHGRQEDVEAFLAALNNPPRLARITAINCEGIPTPDSMPAEFIIVQSEDADGRTSVPPDTAVCESCIVEMRDPNDPRYRYPLIACTECGPRFTITTGLPYDRDHTTMSGFPLCDRCRAEYEDPGSRRYHAQPTACPDCGPRVAGDDPHIVAVARALSEGQIIAVKGIGGYHLACDARNSNAVRRLRERKNRGAKPFAVMVADMATASRIAVVNDDAEKALTDHSRPIVVLPAADMDVHDSVAPHSGTIGVLLPYAPLHYRLFDAGAPSVLVMTSGNLSDEPICTEQEEAATRLEHLADGFLHHDRPIHLPCDDSVVRILSGVPQTIRRSRGMVPTPITLPVQGLACIAVGGELKTTICVSDGRESWFSQHIGDTSSLETLDVLDRTVRTMLDIQRIEPAFVVSDLHPGYLSSQWAARYARDRDLEHLAVQHHHAHMASLLTEHHVADDLDILAFSFDGTGYGWDGSIWGGEALLGSYRKVRRVGFLQPTPLPGGDAATAHPSRVAAAHLYNSDTPWDPNIASIAALGSDAALLRSMLAAGTQCIPTSSIGRLFDAVSSLLDIRHDVDYEGQAAIELEALAEAAEPVDLALPLTQASDGTWLMDPRPLVADVVTELRRGAPVAGLARGFHRALAAAATQLAIRVRETEGVEIVGLTGGVFANRLLTEDLQGSLRQEGFGVLLHREVPSNDGGLALGQVAVASAGGAVRWQSHR